MEITVPFISSPIGAGDVVKEVSLVVGKKPCSKCEERRKKWNNLLRFLPRYEEEISTCTKEDGRVISLYPHKVKEIVRKGYVRVYNYPTKERAEEKFNSLCH